MGQGVRPHPCSRRPCFPPACSCSSSSARIERWLGARTLRAIEKLAGMLLILLAVQMFLDGLAPRAV